MAIPFSKQVSIPNDILRRQLEEESIIVSLDNGMYFGLDGVGTRMLSVLLRSESVQQAYEQLLGQYDVSAARLREDLEQFIEKLLEQGLIQLRGD